MKRDILKTVLSGILAATMTISVAMPTYAMQTETDIAEQTVNYAENISLENENQHAYNPFEEIEQQMENEEFRESAEIVEKKILFTVREYRKDGEKAVYWNDENQICKTEGLSKIANILDVKATQAEIKEGFTAYDVYYEAYTKSEDVWSVVDKLLEHEEIVIAEPDYVREPSVVGSATVASSAEIDSCWQLGNLEIPSIWDKYFSDDKAPGENVVVAVIDTGVDYNHKDLAGNMWVNDDEIADNGIDDDGNGYVDDIHGISLIDNSGDPIDDHGHGTHVAGIIAMDAGNGGGVGVAYGSKIMAIKAGQSNGVFASSDIAKAINYAAANGADIINMSFGGTGKSALEEAALADAFGSCVLVASAGNDGMPTTDAPQTFIPSADNYPAGYSYVIGVMASNQLNKLASFSNWDYISGINCEYEMIAPGVAIYSTLPNNRYAAWSGTSMSAPMVSAAAAIIRSKYPDKSKYTSRYIMGQLTSATEDSVLHIDELGGMHIYPKLDITDSINNQPKPDLNFPEIYIFDSKEIAPENNGDGVVQAGETIDLAFSVWNRWGIADNPVVSVNTLSDGGVENPYVEILANDVQLDDVGTFAAVNNGYTYTNDELTSVTKPIRLKISDTAPNDAMVTLKLSVTAKNGMDETDKTNYTSETDYTFIIQNGYALSGRITEDMTLTKDKYWIIENNVLIPEGVTVTVEPGTQIQFWSSDENNPYGEEAIVYIKVEGRFIAEGTEEEPIEMFPGKGYENYAVSIMANCDTPDETKEYASIKYANVINPGVGHTYVFEMSRIDHCKLIQNAELILEKSLDDGAIHISQWFGSSVCSVEILNTYIQNFSAKSSSDASKFVFKKLENCIFNKMRLTNIYAFTADNTNRSIKNTLFLGNSSKTVFTVRRFYDETVLDFDNNAILNNLNDSDVSNWFRIYTDSYDNCKELDISGNYWGTENANLVKKQVYDADFNVNYTDLIQEPYLTLESESLEDIYPFVTDVYLTDKDGNVIENVSGSQEVTFHVLFNRSMAQDVQPMVSYGGSAPYTDYTVSGDWVSEKEWSGTMQIDPWINQGAMYMRIKNAAAADDKWLITGTDEARFKFEVAASSAEAMTLQGSGEAGKNVLSWVQDDYETLAGYNLYRSETYDNTIDVSAQGFEKVNTSIIDNATEEFEDTDVEQGVDYYYYFTIVDTDFNETKPSNVVMCTPTDIDVPIITHKAIATVLTGKSVTIAADVTDNVSVESVKLYYKMSDADTWQSADMKKTTGDTYQAVISSYEISEGTMQYYIAASDGTNTTYCGNEKTPNVFAVVSSDAHNYVSKVTKEATCTEDGEITFSCDHCGDVYTETVESAGHDYTEKTVSPTCSKDGKTVYTCSECGYGYTVVLPATGHEYEETVVPPTCNELGYTKHICKNCGSSYNDCYVDEFEHTYTESVLDEVTCVKNGVKKYTCECGASYTEVINATGHEYKETVVPAKCGAEGYTLHKCEICNISYKDTYTEELYHKFGEWVESKAPTCMEQGENTRKCSLCSESETETVLAKGDVNRDGTVGISDVVMLQKYLSNSSTISKKATPDINDDGKVNVFDMIILKRCVCI